MRVLLFENDVQFILKIQKLFPRETEWLATMDQWEVGELLRRYSFDLMVVRKKNRERFVTAFEQVFKPVDQLPLKKIVILPAWFWKKSIKEKLNDFGPYAMG